MKRRFIFVSCCYIFLLMISMVFAQGNDSKGDDNLTIEDNKRLVNRFFKEVFNERNPAVINDLYAEDVVDHSAFPDQEPGRDGIISAISGFFEAFDSLNIVVEDIVAEGDKVVTRETWRVSDSSMQETLTGTVIHIFRIRDGRITDEWSRGWDWLE